MQNTKTISLINSNLMNIINTQFIKRGADNRVKVLYFYSGNNLMKIVDELQSLPSIAEIETAEAQGFKLYSYYPEDGVIKIAVCQLSNSLEIQEPDTNDNYLMPIFELNLDNFWLGNISEKQIENLFKLTSITYHSGPYQLSLRNNEVWFPDNNRKSEKGIELGVKELDLENTIIHIQRASQLLISTGGEYLIRISLRDVKIISNYGNCDDSLFQWIFFLEEIDITGLRILNRNQEPALLNRGNLFLRDYRLKTIEGLIDFLQNNKVTDLSYSFSYCYKLEKIDLSIDNWSNINTMRGTFISCTSLKEINLGDISKVKDSIITGNLFNEKNKSKEEELTDIINLKLNHIGKFKHTIKDEINPLAPSSEEYISSVLTPITQNEIDIQFDLFHHTAIITPELLKEMVVQLHELTRRLKPDKREIDISNIQINQVENNEEIKKAIVKQKLLGGEYEVFKNLVALYSEDLNNIAVVISKA